MPKESISTPDAPGAVGPYVQGVKAAGLLFCSGQIPLDPTTGEIVGDSAPEQAIQCLKNLDAVCGAAGTSLASAVKITVLMTDLSQFTSVNAAYATYFEGSEPPARIAYGVVALPKGAQVEIDAVVAL
jgi:2-iminobutanoate/2-iminopropanoate deaminase